MSKKTSSKEKPLATLTITDPEVALKNARNISEALAARFALYSDPKDCKPSFVSLQQINVGFYFDSELLAAAEARDGVEVSA